MSDRVIEALRLLKEERETINIAIEALQRLAGAEHFAAGEVAAPAPKKRGRPLGSVTRNSAHPPVRTEAMRLLMQAVRPMTAPEVMRALAASGTPVQFRATVNSALTALKLRGFAQNHGRGYSATPVGIRAYGNLGLRPPAPTAAADQAMAAGYRENR